MKKRAFVYLLLAGFSTTLLSCEDVDLGVGAALTANLTQTTLNIKTIDGTWQLASVEVKVDSNSYSVNVGDTIKNSLTGTFEIQENLGSKIKFFNDSVANYLPDRTEPVKGTWNYNDKNNIIVLFKDLNNEATYSLNRLSTQELYLATKNIDLNKLNTSSNLSNEQQLALTVGMPIVVSKIGLSNVPPNAKIQMILKYKR